MRASSFRLAELSALCLLGLVLWDVSGMDLSLAFAAGDAQGFPLRDNWWLVQVLHDGVKTLAWLFLMFVCIAVVWTGGATARVATGLVLGLGQHLRGARFMSHTLWTGWLCWMVAWLTDPVFAGSDAALLPGGRQ